MKKISILVVDDTVLIAESLKFDLEKNGYNVTAAFSGEEAVKELDETDFDIIITDLIMGKLDGFGVLKKAKAKHASTKVIILTAYSSVDTAIEAVRLHADDFLQKPCKKGEMLLRVEKCIRELELESNINGHIQTEERLRASEKALRKQKDVTEQKNVALNEMLKQLEVEKKKIRDNVLSNTENFLLPLIDKLKLSGESKKYVKLLRKNVNELISSFGVNLLTINNHLTSRETEICNMIKNGLSSKEIASLLHIGLRTVDTHRNNIRRKLNVDKRNVNLESFLKTL